MEQYQNDSTQNNPTQIEEPQNEQEQNDPTQNGQEQNDSTQNDPPTLTININDISQWQCNYNLNSILTYLIKAIETTNSLRQQQFETVNSLIDQFVQEDVILLMQSLQKYLNNWYFQKQFYQLADYPYDETTFKITLLPINPFTVKGLLSVFNHLSAGIYAATYNWIGSLISYDLSAVRYSQQRKDRPLSVYLLKRFKYQLDEETRSYKKVSTQIHIIAQSIKKHSSLIDKGKRSNQIDKWKITQSIWKMEIPVNWSSTETNTTITSQFMRMFKVFDDEILPTEGLDYQLHCPYYPYVEMQIKEQLVQKPVQENIQEDVQEQRSQPEFSKAILSRNLNSDPFNEGNLRSDISFKVSDWTSIAADVNASDVNASNTPLSSIKLSSKLQFIIADYMNIDIDESYNAHDDFTLYDFGYIDYQEQEFHGFYVIEPKEEYWSKKESQTYEELVSKINEQLEEQMQQ